MTNVKKTYWNINVKKTNNSLSELIKRFSFIYISAQKTIIKVIYMILFFSNSNFFKIMYKKIADKRNKPASIAKETILKSVSV